MKANKKPPLIKTFWTEESKSAFINVIKRHPLKKSAEILGVSSQSVSKYAQMLRDGEPLVNWRAAFSFEIEAAAEIIKSGRTDYMQMLIDANMRAASFFSVAVHYGIATSQLYEAMIRLNDKDNTSGLESIKSQYARIAKKETSNEITSKNVLYVAWR